MVTTNPDTPAEIMISHPTTIAEWEPFVGIFLPDGLIIRNYEEIASRIIDLPKGILDDFPWTIARNICAQIYLHLYCSMDNPDISTKRLVSEWRQDKNRPIPNSDVRKFVQAILYDFSPLERLDSFIRLYTFCEAQRIQISKKREKGKTIRGIRNDAVHHFWDNYPTADEFHQSNIRLRKCIHGFYRSRGLYVHLQDEQWVTLVCKSCKQLTEGVTPLLCPTQPIARWE